jgi:hypothetical protein
MIPLLLAHQAAHTSLDGHQKEKEKLFDGTPTVN